jgi:hypothetical protein
MEELKFASKNEALQYLANFTRRSIKVASENPLKSPLDGMTKDKAKKYISQIFNTHNNKSRYHDESWAPVNQIFNEMSNKELDWNLIKAEYKKDGEGISKSKQWDFEVKFINNKDRETILYGHIVASGTGTVKDPLESYDLVTYIN